MYFCFVFREVIHKTNLFFSVSLRSFTCFQIAAGYVSKNWLKRTKLKCMIKLISHWVNFKLKTTRTKVDWNFDSLCIV